MDNAVTITLSKNNYPINVMPINKGDKIELKKSSEILFIKRIKPKRMIYRLLKKKFKPIFIVTSGSGYDGYFSFQMKSYNF